MTLQKFKKYILENIEDTVILGILAGAVMINFLLYSKLAFLDFFYLLIVLAGYYLGKRFAILGAFFSILMVWAFILSDSKEYVSPVTPFEVQLNLTVWGGFLILAAWLIGSLSEKLKRELREGDQLREALAQEREILKISNDQVNDQNRRLEEIVSERTRELETKNQELKEFTAVASHDLKEPLRKVVLFSQQLRKRISPEDDHCQEYLARMQKSALRMQTFIDDLLKLSQVTMNTRSMEPIDLNQTVQEALDNLEVAVEKTQGSVNVGFLPTLESDAMQMRQLFQNLIGNALKFHQKGVPPVVFLNSNQDHQGRWVISVSDNGVGIDHHKQGQIFRPFERLQGRSEYEGSGMGLAICKKITERHGGNISVFSERNKGTTFQVTLPETQTSSSEVASN